MLISSESARRGGRPRRVSLRVRRGHGLVAASSARTGSRCSSSQRASSGTRSPPRPGGASSPDTLYYGLRNGLVVAERWSPRRPAGLLRAGARPPRPISRRPYAPIAEARDHEPSARGGETSGASGAGRAARHRSRCGDGSSPTGSASVSACVSSPVGAGSPRGSRSVSSFRWTRAGTSSCPGRYDALGVRAGQHRARPGEPEAPLRGARAERRAGDLGRRAPRGDREVEEHRGDEPDLELRVADGRALPFEDATFDHANERSRSWSTWAARGEMPLRSRSSHGA